MIILRTISYGLFLIYDYHINNTRSARNWQSIFWYLPWIVFWCFVSFCFVFCFSKTGMGTYSFKHIGINSTNFINFDRLVKDFENKSLEGAKPGFFILFYLFIYFYVRTVIITSNGCYHNVMIMFYLVSEDPSFGWQVVCTCVCGVHCGYASAWNTRN